MPIQHEYYDKHLGKNSKKSTLQAALLISCTLLFFTNAQAGEEEKKFSIGLGTYGFTLTYSNQQFLDDEFGGFAINAAYAVNDNVAIKGALFSLEYDFPGIDVESDGYDLAIVAGTGLATEGFKIYGGLGIFNDTWSSPGFYDSEFSGLQLVGGLGYNWEAISLDLSFGVRDADEYSSSVSTAVSAGLIVSVRL